MQLAGPLAAPALQEDFEGEASDLFFNATDRIANIAQAQKDAARHLKTP
jgi:hypothetical protein